MRALLAALAWCLLATAGAHAADANTAVGAADPQRQILVLLNLPPAHYRPDRSYGAGYADPSGSAARRRVAVAIARDNGLDLVTAWPMPLLGLDCYVMLVPGSRQADEVAARVSLNPSVAWAQPMNTFRSLAHGDPLLGLQPAAREWHLSELHRASTGRGVRVAIIDSGIEDDHPDLAGQVAIRANFVGDGNDRPEAHGTAVAGIVAARADNDVGIAGVAPQARLLALRACRQASPGETLCTTFGLASALHAGLERGAQIINLSLSGPPDRLIQQSIEAALKRGVGVVAAADRALPKGGFPAAVPGVVAVADESSGPTLAGMWAAPGTDVMTTLPDSRWGLVSGASYAAAHVSGLLALVLEARPKTLGAATPLAAALVARPDGRVDACASLSRARSECACECSGTAPTLGAAAFR